MSTKKQYLSFFFVYLSLFFYERLSIKLRHVKFSAHRKLGLVLVFNRNMESALKTEWRHSRCSCVSIWNSVTRKVTHSSKLFSSKGYHTKLNNGEHESPSLCSGSKASFHTVDRTGSKLSRRPQSISNKERWCVHWQLPKVRYVQSQ